MAAHNCLTPVLGKSNACGQNTQAAVLNVRWRERVRGPVSIYLYSTIDKNTQVWWCVPVVPVLMVQRKKEQVVSQPSYRKPNTCKISVED